MEGNGGRKERGGMGIQKEDGDKKGRAKGDMKEERDSR